MTNPQEEPEIKHKGVTKPKEEREIKYEGVTKSQKDHEIDHKGVVNMDEGIEIDQKGVLKCYEGLAKPKTQYPKPKQPKVFRVRTEPESAQSWKAMGCGS